MKSFFKAARKWASNLTKVQPSQQPWHAAFVLTGKEAEVDTGWKIEIVSASQKFKTFVQIGQNFEGNPFGHEA